MTSSTDTLFDIGSAIDPGRKRQGGPNQDSITVLLPKAPGTYSPVLVLADGMGGYTGGAIASQIIIQSFNEIYLQIQQSSLPFSDLSETVITLSLRRMQEKAKEDSQFQNMGSTLAAVCLGMDKVDFANVGDSRIYLIRKEEIKQLSYDHSFVGDAIRAGLLTPIQAANHPKKNQLTQSVSARRSEVRAYHGSHPLTVDDVILLCSDGVWGVVSESMIQAVAMELPPQPAAEKLIKLANSRGGPDNISVIIARRSGSASNHADLDMDESE